MFRIMFSVFTIGFSAQGRTLTSSYVMRFTKVVSNVGNGYSSTTGAFTCDHPGLYYFSLTGIKIHSLDNTSPISCAIRRNHIVQTTSFTDPNTRGAYSTGTSLVIHLAHGDRVDVGNCTVAASLSFLPPSFITAFVLDSDSTFSGFLLQSD